MKLVHKLSKEKRPPKLKNIYVLTCHCMIGDADSFPVTTTKFLATNTKEMEYLHTLLPVFEKIVKEDSEKARWTMQEFWEGIDDEDFLDHTEDTIPYDSQGDCMSKLDYFELNYYDEKGVKHDVDIKEDK